MSIVRSLTSLITIVTNLYRNRPTAISFNVTHECNLSCMMCNIYKTPMPELSLSQIGNIMKDLKHSGFRVVEITGGEPFLRRDIFDIFELLENLDFRYTLNTNGTLLNTSRVHKLQRLRGILQIAVSIDSLRNEVFQRIRGHNLLPRVLSSLDLLVEAQLDIPIKVNLTMNRFNYSEIDDYLALCKDKQLFLSVFPVNLGSDFRHRALNSELIPSDREREEMAKTFERLASLRKKGAPLWEHSSFYQGAATYLRFGFVPPCDAGKLFFDLHTDGKLAVCNDLPPFADLTKESFSDCMARVKSEQPRIEKCYQCHPCYYTCTYAISAISRNKLQYAYETLRVMGMSRFIHQFLK